ncbi:hypothetical protein MTO96_029830, partial [Rhipicephalus appendiculatus]
ERSRVTISRVMRTDTATWIQIVGVMWIFPIIGETLVAWTLARDRMCRTPSSDISCSRWRPYPLRPAGAFFKRWYESRRTGSPPPMEQQRSDLVS